MTLQQQNWPFRFRVLFLTSLIAFAACLTLGWPLTNAISQSLKAQNSLLRDTLTQQASSQAADAIFSQDLVSLNVMLSTLVNNPEVAYAAVYDLENHVVAEQGISPDTVTTHSVRLLYQDQMIGSFQLVLNPGSLNSAITRVYSLWLILSLLVMAIAALIGWHLGQRHGQRLSTLSEQIAKLSATSGTEQQDEILLHGQGELMGLSQNLKDHAQLQKAQRDMQRALARFTHSGLSAGMMEIQPDSIQHEEYTRAAVLFIDFVDFEKTAKSLSPGEMANLLNQYYFLIHQAARLYNGTVDKYVGDGIMVLFGVPQHDEKDCFHGVCTALLLIGLLYEFNARRRSQQQPILEFKMGLHTGTVLTGMFGDEEQQNYSIVGDALHQAARLCRKGQAQRLVVSQDVMEAGKLTSTLSVENAFSLKASQPGQTLECVWVNDLAPNYRALIQRQVQHIRAQVVDEKE